MREIVWRPGGHSYLLKPILADRTGQVQAKSPLAYGPPLPNLANALITQRLEIRVCKPHGVGATVKRTENENSGPNSRLGRQIL